MAVGRERLAACGRRRAGGRCRRLFLAEVQRRRTPFALVGLGKAHAESRDLPAAIAQCTEAAAAVGLVRAGFGVPGQRLPRSTERPAGLGRSRSGDSGRSAIAQAYSLRGQARTILRQFDQAMADFDSAIRLDPKGCSTYARRGTAWSKQAHIDEALADFDTALRLNPYYVVALNNRANVWFKKGEFRLAIKDYTAALQIKPVAEDLYFNRAIAWARLGEQGRAMQDYSETIRLNPRYAPAYYHRANLRLEQGDRARAADDFKRASALVPGNKET